jgi:hypothetical protein
MPRKSKVSQIAGDELAGLHFGLAPMEFFDVTVAQELIERIVVD